MKERVRVLQVLYTPQGSTAAVGHLIAESLDPTRFDVMTISLTGGQPSHNRSTHHYLDLPTWSLKGLLRWIVVLRLVRLCRKFDVKLVIAHRFKPVHLGLLVGRILSIPVLSVIHAIGDYDRPYRRHLVKSLIKPNDRFVGVSTTVRDYLLSLDCGLSGSNTLSINNAIDFERVEERLLEPREARAALCLPEDRFIVGTVGRLVPVKAQHCLLNAAMRLSTRHPKLMIVIVGDGRERSALENLITDHNLEEHVRLLGHRQEAVRYLRAFDTFALPSLSEGFPLVLLEAMAAGLPIVGSSIPSISSIIGELGWLHPPGDADQLAACIDQIAQMTTQARTHRGALLRKQARTLYDIAVFAEAYNTLLNEALESSSPLRTAI